MTKHHYTCYRCAKIIKGETIMHTPPMHLIKLGLDFCKAFHPGCYAKAEKEAAAELRIAS